MQKPQPATSHARARILLCFKESQFQTGIFQDKKLHRVLPKRDGDILLGWGTPERFSASASLKSIDMWTREESIFLLDKGCASVLCQVRFPEQAGCCHFRCVKENRSYGDYAIRCRNHLCLPKKTCLWGAISKKMQTSLFCVTWSLELAQDLTKRVNDTASNWRVSAASNTAAVKAVFPQWWSTLWDFCEMGDVILYFTEFLIS